MVQESNTHFRTEHDWMGEKEVPIAAYYGVQTVRATDNFAISGIMTHPELVRAIAQVKQAAAETNIMLGMLDRAVGEAIMKAAREVSGGLWNSQFPVDVFQAGAGVSFNMNANEVIANRAAELLGAPRGDYTLVHPNDHVNMSQSTNDVFPAALRLAALSLAARLVTSLEDLEDSLQDRASEFEPVIKPGRTHLRDAVPVRLGRVFSAYAETIHRAIQHLHGAVQPLQELGLGGTAVGTGINTHPEYAGNVIRRLAGLTGLDLKPSINRIEATHSMAAFAAVSASLRLLALELIRICNDLRLMSSGPNTGLGEIDLPAVQPGSSIMPGKVNPVLAEALNMVCFQVMGNDLTIAMACQAGQLELNVMTPVISFNLLQSLEILTNAIGIFSERCVRGITANAEHCRGMAERSLAMATVLNNLLGYEVAAQLARQSQASGRSVKELVLEKGLLTTEQVLQAFDLQKMTG